MENDVIDYLSFVRGFIAAMNQDNPGHSAIAEPGAGVDFASYAAGFAAGSAPIEPVMHYRELSVQDGGQFTGTLDFPPAGAARDDLSPLSGVLDLSNG